MNVANRRLSFIELSVPPVINSNAMSSDKSSKPSFRPKSRPSISLKPLKSLKSKSTQRGDEAARAKLDAARFRWLNEQLYTCTGDEAQALFESNPELFDARPPSPPYNLIRE